MANIRLRGDAQDVAQTETFTITNTANTRTIGITINSKEIVYTCTATDDNAGAAGLHALLSTSTLPEFQEISWTVATNVITGTNQPASLGATFTTTATATGGATNTKATTSTARGKNHWDDADNWDLGRLPAGECASPVQANPVASSGGTLVDTTTYYWVVTATNALGETLKSNEKTLTIAAPNQQVTISWALVVGATGYKVYRSTTTGVYTPTALAGTISSGSTLTFLDTGAALSAGAVPGANTALGDDVYLTQTATSILYGINLSYLVLNSLHVDTTYTGTVGLPDYNPNGYYEYRTTYLQVAAKNVYFGENNVNGGAGSSLFRIDKGTVNTTAFQIYQTGNPQTQGLPALYLKGAHASDTLVCQQGYIGCAMGAGETAQFTTIQVGYQTSPPTDVQLTLGIGCTLATITQLGGVIICNANVTSLTVASGSQGSFYLNGAATMGTAILDGGTYYCKTVGTHTTVKVNFGGVFDHQQDIRAMTITNLTLSDGCSYFDPAGSIIWTNPAILNGNLANMTTNFGTNRNLQFS